MFTTYIIKEYNKDEFFSLFASFTEEVGVNLGNLEFDHNTDDPGFIKAIIQNNVLARLTPDQIAVLDGYQKKP